MVITAVYYIRYTLMSEMEELKFIYFEMNVLAEIDCSI
jgi:hypothetical protein